jgi:hypothetical protein
MRVFAAVLLGMMSACRHAPPETEPRVPDCPCASANCCEPSKDQWDVDSGADDRKRADLEAWLLPDDGGTEEVGEGSRAWAPDRLPAAEKYKPPLGWKWVPLNNSWTCRRPVLCPKGYWLKPDGGTESVF